MKINFKPTDDDYHKIAGALVSSVSGFLLYYFGFVTPLWAYLIGFLLGCLSGLAKDYLWDRFLKKGVFSKWDIVSTIFGSVFGVLILIIIIVHLNKHYYIR